MEKQEQQHMNPRQKENIINAQTYVDSKVKEQGTNDQLQNNDQPLEQSKQSIERENVKVLNEMKDHAQQSERLVPPPFMMQPFCFSPSFAVQQSERPVPPAFMTVDLPKSISDKGPLFQNDGFAVSPEFLAALEQERRSSPSAESLSPEEEIFFPSAESLSSKGKVFFPSPESLFSENQYNLDKSPFEVEYENMFNERRWWNVDLQTFMEGFTKNEERIKSVLNTAGLDTSKIERCLCDYIRQLPANQCSEFMELLKKRDLIREIHALPKDLTECRDKGAGDMGRVISYLKDLDDQTFKALLAKEEACIRGLLDRRGLDSSGLENALCSRIERFPVNQCSEFMKAIIRRHELIREMNALPRKVDSNKYKGDWEKSCKKIISYLEDLDDQTFVGLLQEMEDPIRAVLDSKIDYSELKQALCSRIEKVPVNQRNRAMRRIQEHYGKEK